MNLLLFSRCDVQLQSCNGSVEDSYRNVVQHVETWATKTLVTVTTSPNVTANFSRAMEVWVMVV